MKWFRAILGAKSAQRWAAEIAGVGALAIAGWMIFAPAGIAVLGVYLVLVANAGGD